MKFDEVKEIINIINDSELSYFEVNIDNNYIKMDKSMSRSYGSLNQSYSNISEIIDEKSLDTNLNNNIEAAIDNEISSDFDCEIIDVLVENGVMVEYGEPLFKIRRR